MSGHKEAISKTQVNAHDVFKLSAAFIIIGNLHFPLLQKRPVNRNKDMELLRFILLKVVFVVVKKILSHLKFLENGATYFISAF